MRHSEAEQQGDLPAWLTRESSYEPATDRDSFLRKNVLALARALAMLRAEPAAASSSMPDRFLCRVSDALRLVGTLVVVVCVSLAQNLAFVWTLLAALLCGLALRPARVLAKSLAPAALAALVALLVNLPALLIGQPTAPVRMCSKTFVTVCLMANLAQALGSDGMVGALRGLGVPMRVVTIVDLALRDIVLLGEAAVSLSEALSLRSVGVDRSKTSSAAGVMGAVFVRAHRTAQARAEAMALRGYGEDWKPGKRRVRVTAPDVAYALLVLVVVLAFAYLEGVYA